MFQNGSSLTIKTANCNSPWAYIQEGLLSEGYLHLRFWGLIFGRASYQNFMAYIKKIIVSVAKKTVLYIILNVQTCTVMSVSTFHHFTHLHVVMLCSFYLLNLWMIS